jgi:Putative zinc-finger
MKRKQKLPGSCRSIFRFICENLDNDLNSPECRNIKKHIAACKNCSAYLQSLKKTILLYQTYPTPQSPRLAGKIASRLALKTKK